METALVILNFNGIKWLKKFLPNVIQHSDKDAEVIIIDNGSSDKSTDYLTLNFPTLKVISLKSNSGFTGGYNQGLKALTHKYFILLLISKVLFIIKFATKFELKYFVYLTLPFLAIDLLNLSSLLILDIFSLKSLRLE